ncbi:hypothetical protein SBOR_5641 [Sclerotinia borealis F-4128]|uniref:Uncharacterized protein n=1 Tax=Sclerotinia borealis (strain F-4128) TaxID=1432307 RepID=W9CDN3_SCLBF|nr:hypothetical protein SBOR_5641 [Sclerotinia borealis F-4128]
MPQIMNRLRHIARSIKGACHINRKNRRSARAPTITKQFDQSVQEDQASHDPIEQQSSAGPNDASADHIPITLRAYSMSPQVTMPVQSASVEPRVATQNSTLHHPRGSITAQSSSLSPRVVAPQTSSYRLLRGSDTARSTPLGPRIVSNPEPPASRSRIPVPVRSSSLQPRVTTPVVSDPQRRAPIYSEEHAYISSIPVANRPASSQSRVVSAPPPYSSHPQVASSARSTSLQSRVPIPSQQLSLQRTTPNAARPESLQPLVPFQTRQSTLPLSRTPTADRLTSVQPDSANIAENLSLRVAILHRPSSSRQPLQEVPTSTAGGRSSTRRPNLKNDGASTDRVAGAMSSTNRRHIHSNAVDRSSTNRRSTQSNGTGSTTLFRRRPNHADSTGSMHVESGSPVREYVTDPTAGPRQSGSPPSYSDVISHSNQSITPYPRRELQSARGRGLPRSPGMFFDPFSLIEDEINDPIHPNNVSIERYVRNFRIPDSYPERAPAPRSSPVAGHHEDRDSGLHRRSRGEIRAARKAREAGEAREAFIIMILDQVRDTDDSEIDECFCLEPYAGHLHEAVHMPLLPVHCAE